MHVVIDVEGLVQQHAPSLPMAFSDADRVHAGCRNEDEGR